MLTLLLVLAALGAPLHGRVVDEIGGALPGVSVELHAGDRVLASTVTTRAGEYAFADVPPGRYDVAFALANFAFAIRRNMDLASTGAELNVVLHLVLDADVTVTGRRTFANLADVDRPAENLVGIAQSASQGAITARQLDGRPIGRQGEVLESVPGVIVA